MQMRVSFTKQTRPFAPVTVSDTNIEVVESAKLLCLTISADLKWSCHVSNIISKVSSGLDILKQLKRAQILDKDLLLFYITCIRPLTESACQVYHNALPEYLSEDLERLQRRALRILYTDISYAQVLEKSGLLRLSERREALTARLFDDIFNNPKHKLRAFLPATRDCPYNLRSNCRFIRRKCNTKRFQSSFINAQLYVSGSVSILSLYIYYFSL